MIVLVILSSFAGAVGVVGGLMLLVGSLNSADFAQGAFADAVEDSWGWSRAGAWSDRPPRRPVAADPGGPAPPGASPLPPGRAAARPTRSLPLASRHSR